MKEKHIFPFIGSTIRTNLPYAFIVMAVASHIMTGDITENRTNSTFLLHVFLLGSEI